jgi:BMFP domain-containing protein YqiC
MEVMACLLEEMRTIHEETNAYQEMMHDGQEKIKAQVGSFLSWIDVNQ